jgi:hypothetical protein
MQSPVLNTGTGAILVWGPPNQPGTAFLNTRFLQEQPPSARLLGTATLYLCRRYHVNAADATDSDIHGEYCESTTASFIGFTSDVAITSVLFRTPQGQTGWS